VTESGGGFSYNGDQGQREIQIGENRRVTVGDSGADVFFRIRRGNGVFVAAASDTNNGTGIVTTNSVTNPTVYDHAQYTVRFIDAGNYEILNDASAVVGTGTFQPGSSIAFQGVQFTVDGQPAAGDEFVVSPSPHQSVFDSVRSLVEAIEQPVAADADRAALNNSVNRGLEDLDQSIGNVLEIRTRVGSRLATIENQIDTNGALALTLQETIGQLEDLDYAEALSRLSFQLTTLEAAQQTFVRTQSLSLFNYF
jgi:flagellar hook-associated protein 3 FlgL